MQRATAQQPFDDLVVDFSSTPCLDRHPFSIEGCPIFSIAEQGENEQEIYAKDVPLTAELLARITHIVRVNMPTRSCSESNSLIMNSNVAGIGRTGAPPPSKFVRQRAPKAMVKRSGHM